jgi:hypothetical protein
MIGVGFASGLGGVVTYGLWITVVWGLLIILPLILAVWLLYVGLTNRSWRIALVACLPALWLVLIFNLANIG